jgi:hypothetical protein
MANYGAELTKAITSTTVGLGSIEAPAANMRRVAIYDLVFGSSVAGDTQFLFELNRSTTAATGTAVTPNALDPADPASVTLAKQNLTVQGTNTAGAIPLAVPQNQRATFRWACRDGKEIIIPAVANAGVHINTPVALLTPTATVTVMFDER